MHWRMIVTMAIAQCLALTCSVCATDYSEDFGGDVSKWTFEEGTSVVKDGETSWLELAPKAEMAAIATSDWIPVRKSYVYILEYTIQCVSKGGTDTAEYQILPMLPYSRRTNVDAAVWHKCSDTLQRKVIRFETTPIQEKLQLKIVAKAPGKVRITGLKLLFLGKVHDEPTARILLDKQFQFSHGVFEPSDAKEITGVVRVYYPKAADCVMAAIDAFGKVVFRKEVSRLFEDDMFKKKYGKNWMIDYYDLKIELGSIYRDIEFSVPVPQVGTETILRVVLKNRGGQTESIELPLTHYRHKVNQVSFRDDGMAIVDGKPFFMIAHWWFTRRGDKGGNVDWWYENDLDVSDDMQFLKDAGFNTLLVRTPQHVRLAGEHGLKAIIHYPERLPNEPSARDAAIEAYRKENMEVREHPALLAYYAPDEPIALAFPLNKALETSDMVHCLDPYHPIFYNESPTGTAECQSRYAQLFDVVGRDIYPVGDKNMWHGDLPDTLKLAAVGAHTDICTESVFGRKPVWMILQAFAWYHIYGDRKLKTVEQVTDCQIRYPTYNESRFMAYNAITHGATGIMYHYLGYTVHITEEFWLGLRNVLQELNFLGDVLAERTIANPVMGTKDKNIRMMVKSHGGTNYYFIVNEDDAKCEATFSGFPEKRLFTLLKDEAMEVNGGKFHLTMEPFEVRVMRGTPFPPANEVLKSDKYVRYSDFPTLRGKQD